MIPADHETRATTPVIVCAADDAYALCLATMLHSLEHHLRRYKTIQVVVLYTALKASNRRKIIATLNKKRISLTWIRVDDNRVRCLTTSQRISKATYYRLLIEEALPECPRVLYLDCDLVINNDIGLLWDERLDGALLLAVPQVSPDASTASSKRGLPSYKDLGIPPDTKLFNAGVLSIDLSAWRQHRISERIIEYLHRYNDKVLWWDQDGLNAILHSEWRMLDYRWNVMTSIFRYFDCWKDSPFERAQYYDIITHPFIIHYNSSSKPWNGDYNLPYKEYFFRYLDRTRWCGWRP
jgi:lipopolysaccharide biosynthesis glycosyltransferase